MDRTTMMLKGAGAALLGMLAAGLAAYPGAILEGLFGPLARGLPAAVFGAVFTHIAMPGVARPQAIAAGFFIGGALAGVLGVGPILSAGIVGLCGALGLALGRAEGSLPVGFAAGATMSLWLGFSVAGGLPEPCGPV